MPLHCGGSGVREQLPALLSCDMSFLCMPASPHTNMPTITCHMCRRGCHGHIPHDASHVVKTYAHYSLLSKSIHHLKNTNFVVFILAATCQTTEQVHTHSEKNCVHIDSGNKVYSELAVGNFTSTSNQQIMKFCTRLLGMIEVLKKKVLLI